MGAEYTEQTGIGRDARQAYSSALSDATHEYGHDPYSGTIAAMDKTFIPVSLPKGVTGSKFLKLFGEYAYEAEGLNYQKDELRDPSYKRTKRETAKLETQIKRVEAKLEKLAARLKMDRHVLDGLTTAYNDKWGPALCVELTGASARQAREWHGVKRGRVYKFFGYAPS